jgi:hypothetical protein
MAWEDCVANIKRSYAPRDVKEIQNVDWSNRSVVSQDDLDADNFYMGNPFFLICPDRHCVDYVSTTPADHALCQCKDMSGQPIPGCPLPSALYPEKAGVCLNIADTTQFNAKSSKACIRQGGSWYPLTCYCCCSCFAYGTLIGVPDGFKAIEKFHIGDRVLTADLGAGEALRLDWSPAKVTFSSGTGPDSHQAAMVYIRHGEVGSLVVTPDHLFLMPEGKLKRADRLAPGNDRLITAQGQPVEIHEISIGEYKGGVHHIATDREFKGDLNGHLLISQGVVSGDFSLQVHAPQLKDKYFVPDHDQLPKIGAPQYHELHGLAVGQYRTVVAAAVAPAMSAEAAPAAMDAGADAAQSAQSEAAPVVKASGGGPAQIPKPRKFFVHGQHTAGIPETAAKYLADAQEQDLENNADTYDFSEAGLNAAVVQYVLQLFRGFYPDITFYYDVGRLEANAYAFGQYGRNTVVLPGGMTRIKGLGLEGLSLIVSHLVARLQKSPPRDADGFTSVAMADYYSTTVLQKIFFGPKSSEVYEAGVKQIQDKVFAHITQDNRAYVGDPYSPTTDTRLDALDAGNSMSYPPEGIGGPTFGGLKVTGAQAQAPALNAESFATDDITSEMSAQVFQELQGQQVLDGQGGLAAGAGLDTDLSSLFADQPANRQTLLREEVRYALLHAASEVKVSFSLPLNADTASMAHNYELEPAAKVLGAQVSGDGTSVTLSVALKKGTEYALTVSGAVRAADGSTLDHASNTVSFTLA